MPKCSTQLEDLARVDVDRRRRPECILPIALSQGAFEAVCRQPARQIVNLAGVPLGRSGNTQSSSIARQSRRSTPLTYSNGSRWLAPDRWQHAPFRKRLAVIAIGRSIHHLREDQLA